MSRLSESMILSGHHSHLLSAVRTFVALLVIGLYAGGSTAPSWVTANECENQYQDHCATIPKSEIAQDMRALLGTASATDLTAPDPADLPRLDLNRPRSAYRIGRQDELTITVWGPKDIWSEISAQGQQSPHATVVQDDGTIVLPLLKNVQVEGLTLTEALTKIADLFKTVAGSAFQVDGQITKFRSKCVLLDGAFKKRGVVYLGPTGVPLGEAISGSGGGL